MCLYKTEAGRTVFCGKSAVRHTEADGGSLSDAAPVPLFMPDALTASVHNRQPQISYIRKDPGSLCAAGVFSIFCAETEFAHAAVNRMGDLCSQSPI